MVGLQDQHRIAIAKETVLPRDGLAVDLVQPRDAVGRAWCDAEVNLSLRRLDDALASAEKAHALRPNDLINTTLSRIWVERGDKARAEHFGAQAKIGGWREQLKNPGS
ncbi:MAG: hypothetical protein RLZZ221_1943 [Verrucomicrobiota bacterium]